MIYDPYDPYDLHLMVCMQALFRGKISPLMKQTLIHLEISEFSAMAEQGR